MSKAAAAMDERDEEQKDEDMTWDDDDSDADNEDTKPDKSTDDDNVASSSSSAAASSSSSSAEATPKKKGRGRKKAAAPTVRVSSEDALKRLDLLIAKTERLAGRAALNSAASNASSSSSSSSDAKTGGRKRAGRKTEAAEDEELVKLGADEAEGQNKFARLTVQPTCIVGAMRSYQLEALNWLINLHVSNINGILADEMGLGKTLESLSLLGYLKQYHGDNGPHLIIVPKTTMTNWHREANRWCPSLTAIKFHGDQQERLAMVEAGLSNYNVVITTYEMCNREKAALKKIKWSYLYIDEAHRIKNENSLLSRIVRIFKCKHRLLLTGTPLQNNLRELWALLNFLLPTVFDSADDFESWFIEEESGREAVVKRLHKILRPFLLRRLKVDVEKDLPPKVETKLFVGLSEMQRAWYTKLLSRDLESLNAKGNKMRLLNLVMQLRKVCNHPYLFEGAEPKPFVEGDHLIENCGKMVLLDKLLIKLKAQGSRVLIFSQMTRLLDILEDYCRYKAWKHLRIDGQTKQDERDEAMDLYNAPKSPYFIFLLSTRAGGLGINLQTADTVILFDSDWNPQMDLQAQDRAHRIGQKKQVNIYRFCTQDTIEEKIIERANKKLFLDAVIIKQGKLANADSKLSADELQSWVRFGASRIFSSKESTVTDEDIDAILANGRKRTNEDNAKLQEVVAGANMLDFKLGGDSSTWYEFDGKDYHGMKGPSAPLEFIEPPARERKQKGYGVDEYYRKQLGGTEREARKSGPKVFRATVRHDFQFFNGERLEELEKKDFDSKAKERAKKEKAKADKRKRKTDRAEARKQRAAAANESTTIESAPAAAGAAASGTDASDGVKKEGDAKVKSETPPTKKESKNGKKESKESKAAAKDDSSSSDDDSTSGDESDYTEKKKNKKKKSKKAKKEVTVVEDDDDDDAPALTESEQKEKAKLEGEGFGTWTRRHLQLFIKACERFGRKDVTKISQHVEGKTSDEVRKYHKVFFARIEEMKDHEKYLKAIERGESRLQKLASTQKLLAKKVKRHAKPYLKMTLDYNTTQKTYTEDEDRFLICKMHEVGYGNWEELKRHIRASWQFRFDWWLKSRTPSELSRRCEFLVKLIEKEQLEVDGDEKKKKKSSKKESEKKTAKSPKKPSTSSKKKSSSTKSSSSSKKKPSTKKGKGAAASDTNKRKAEETIVVDSDDDKDDDDDEEETPQPSKKRSRAT